MQVFADLLNTIPAIDSITMSHAQWHIDRLFKPIGNLGKLEVLVIQLAGMLGLDDIPYAGRKMVLVMCADHSVWEEEVAISPKEVTAIQTENMIHGTAGVRVLTEQADANVHVIDVGIDTAEPIPGFISVRVARGSGDIASAPTTSCHQAGKLLSDITCCTQELAKDGATLFGVGELGMTNMTPVAAIVSTVTGRGPKEVAGIGANLPTDKLANKIDVVRRAITLNQSNPQDGVNVLAEVGGSDLVGIARVMLGAASCSLPVLLDGLPSYAATLAACQMSPTIKPCLTPSHLSAEKGTRIALSYLGLESYLNVEIRLGEGNGAAPVMPITEAVYAVYSNMGELAVSNIVLPGNTTSDLGS